MAPVKSYKSDSFEDIEYTRDEYFTDEEACWCCGNKRANDDDNLCSHCRTKLEAVDKHDKRILEYYYEHYYKEKD